MDVLTPEIPQRKNTQLIIELISDKILSEMSFSDVVESNQSQTPPHTVGS